jgi:hypothetical protein
LNCEALVRTNVCMTQARTARDADTIFGFDAAQLNNNKLLDEKASDADKDLFAFLTGRSQEVPSGIDKFRNMSETDVAKSVKLLRETQKDKPPSTLTSLLELVHLMNSVAKAQSLEQSILRQVNGVSYALASYNSGMETVMQVMNNNKSMKACLETKESQTKVPSLTGGLTLEVGTSENKGYRDEMEDEVIVEQNVKHTSNLISGPFSFFAVCDGHGGNAASTHVKKNLVKNLVQELSTSSTVKDALTQAYLQTDKNFIRENENDESGTTCVSALIDLPRNKFWIANAGDSRAVLCRNGTAVRLSEDHKPDRTDEKARIENTVNSNGEHGLCLCSCLLSLSGP